MESLLSSMNEVLSKDSMGKEVTAKIKGAANPDAMAAELRRTITEERAEMITKFTEMFKIVDTDENGFIDKDEARV